MEILDYAMVFGLVYFIVVLAGTLVAGIRRLFGG